jgi:hypothetical protein
MISETFSVYQLLADMVSTSKYLSNANMSDILKGHFYYCFEYSNADPDNKQIKEYLRVLSSGI